MTDLIKMNTAAHDAVKALRDVVEKLPDGAFNIDDFADRTPTAVEAVKDVAGIAVRKPTKNEWVMASTETRHTGGPTFRVHTAKGERSKVAYLISPKLYDDFGDDAKEVRLAVFVNKQGETFLYPMPLSGSTAPGCASCVKQLGRDWGRMVWDHSSRAYQVKPPLTDGANPPTWPVETVRELAGRAFGKNVITSLDHPIAKNVVGDFT